MCGGSYDQGEQPTLGTLDAWRKTGVGRILETRRGRLAGGPCEPGNNLHGKKQFRIDSDHCYRDCDEGFEEGGIPGVAAHKAKDENRGSHAEHRRTTHKGNGVVVVEAHRVALVRPSRRKVTGSSTVPKTV